MIGRGRHAHTLVAAGLVLIGVVTAAPAARADEMSSAFAAPARSQLPLYRFWNGGGSMDPATFDHELDEMAANGAGGIEASTFSTQNATTDPNYTTTESFGTPLWTQRVTELIKAGNDRGLRVDEIYSPRWSASINTITPDEPGSAKEITFGRAWVDAGSSYSGPVPTAALPNGVTKRDLLAALAYRCVSTCGGNGVAVLDQLSVVDVTGQVAAGSSIDFTAPDGPAGTQWVVVGAWMNGTGQTVGAGLPTTSYLLDHFSVNGWNALKDYWEQKVLTPEMKAAWAANGGSLFFDSFELNRSGQQVRHWAPDFLSEFQQRRGYSLVPYLPVVAVTTPAFEFEGNLGARVREDYNQTLSDLLRDYHILPAQEWAHSLGLTLRGQAYSSWGPSPLDVMDLYYRQDIAEGEDHSFESEFDLNFLQTRGTDAWRAMSTAVEMAGRKIVSTECCAERPALGYSRQILLSHMNHQFAAGVNQIVYHGWSHKAPKLATSWPGWGGFNYGVSDDYGPHNPTWGSGDDKRINEYVGRAQTVLRTGKQRSDIAFYQQSKGHSAAGQTGDRYIADLTLEHAGYRYGFLNKTLTATDRAVVRDGRLDPDGEQFKAFVVDSTPNVNKYTGLIDLASARRMAEWASAGLPIFFVGTPPTRAYGNHPEQDTELAKIIAGLLTRPNVKQVATQAELPAALRAAGIKPATDFTTPSTLISTRRETDDTNYYFFFNEGTTRTNTAITLTGAGIPYRLDAYTGKITPITGYERVANGVKLTVAIASGDATIIALTAGNDFTRPKQQRISAASTTADGALFDSAGDIAIRSGAPGDYTTILSDGRSVTTPIGSVPAPKTLANWTARRRFLRARHHAQRRRKAAARSVCSERRRGWHSPALASNHRPGQQGRNRHLHHHHRRRPRLDRRHRRLPGPRQRPQQRLRRHRQRHRSPLPRPARHQPYRHRRPAQARRQPDHRPHRHPFGQRPRPDAHPRARRAGPARPLRASGRVRLDRRARDRRRDRPRDIVAVAGGLGRPRSVHPGRRPGVRRLDVRHSHQHSR